MGARRGEQCVPTQIPTRPPKNNCISNGDGTCMMFNSITQKDERVHDLNFVCKHVSDYMREQEWIDSIVGALE